MTLEFLMLLGKIQMALSVVIAVLCLYRFKSREKYIRLIGYPFIVGFLCNAAGLLLGKYQLRAFYNVPNFVYVISAFCLFSAAYYHLLNRKYKSLFIALTIGFLAVALLNFFLYQKNSMNSYTYVGEAIVIIIYAILYFYKLLVELPEQHIHRLPMFWINSALLIFFSGTFILYTFTSYLTNVLKDDLIAYWSFHNMLSLFQHLLIIVGLCYDISRLRTNPVAGSR